MFSKKIRIVSQITARSRKLMQGDQYKIGIIITEESDELSNATEGKFSEIKAATVFMVDGEDNIPERGDSVDVVVDCESGESQIIWKNDWYA